MKVKTGIKAGGKGNGLGDGTGPYDECQEFGQGDCESQKHLANHAKGVC